MSHHGRSKIPHSSGGKAAISPSHQLEWDNPRGCQVLRKFHSSFTLLLPHLDDEFGKGSTIPTGFDL